MHVLPRPIQDVLDLFSTDLAGVRFGDIDAQTLAEGAASVAAAAADLAVAETAFTEARRGLQEREEALRAHVQRALSYARVYADANPTLRSRLDAIALSDPALRGRAPGRSGRTGGGAGTSRFQGAQDVETATASTEEAPPQAESRPRGRPRKSPPTMTEPLLESVAASAE